MNQIRLHPKQAEVISAKERFLGAIAGVQGGKTTVGAIWLCDKIWKAYEAGKKGDWLITAPTYKILQQATLPRFRETYPYDWGRWYESKQEFELSWGGKIYVRSADDPNAIESMTLLGAWADEVGQMKHQAWINLQARVAVNQGSILMTTSWYALNWFYREVYKRSGIDPDIRVISWTSIDNPAFPKEEFERAKRTLPEAIFKRRYCAEPTQLEGLVYPTFNESLLVKPFEIPKYWKKFGGLDFGHTNPTALLCIAEDPDKHDFYAFREFYKSESNLQQVADLIHAEDLKYVLGDPQSAQLIVEFNRHYSLNVLPADNDIDVGTERINVLLREGRLKFFNNLENTVDEIETYHYPAPDPDRVTQDKPVAKKNHAMDALRYAFSKKIERNLYSKYALSDNPGRSKRYYAQVSRRDMVPDPYTGYLSL